MNRIVYKFNADTGEYIGEYQCQMSPLEPGKYLDDVPNTLKSAPPDVAANEVACAVDGAWVVKPDYRGVWYKADRSAVTIDEIGTEPDLTWTAAPAALSISELISAQLQHVNADCETSMSSIKAGYPESEVLSWPKQEEEARAWTVDNAAATPLLDALATARGITKADLAARVISKADLFAQISGQTIGKRQGLEDQLNALLARYNDPQNQNPVTQAEIEAIAW